MKGLIYPIALVVLTACASAPTARQQLGSPTASARLEARSDSSVTGSVEFHARPDGRTMVIVKASGLTPDTTHGFHIHENGDCSAPDASSAGGHFNPAAVAHGGPADSSHHAGDFGNLAANRNGEIYNEIIVDFIRLSGSDTVVGRSAVLHADPDDLTSQPAGNSGKRIACGVITTAN